MSDEASPAEPTATCAQEAEEAPPPLGLVCRYSDVFPRVVIDEDTPHPAAVVALTPELPLGSWARALAHVGLRAAPAATLAAYFWTSHRFAAAAGLLWMVAVLAWALTRIHEDEVLLDEVARAVVLVRRIGGVEAREVLCGFQELAAVTVAGEQVAGKGLSGHGTTWRYRVVAVTTAGATLPLSASYEESPKAANQAARVVAAKTGAPFEAGPPYQVLALDVDPEAGALLIRHEPGEGRLTRDTPRLVSWGLAGALLLLAALT